jgi:toxin-antitoxin system PIN domain toxin
VILPDINLLIYAHNEAATQHVPARVWWEDLLTRQQPVGLAWAVIFGFIRLTTHAMVLCTPLSPTAALQLVEGWLAVPSVAILEPGPRHLAIVGQLFEQTEVAGNLTTDAHLAALAIEHQCELHSNDLDFGRFAGLRWHNPLS